MVTTGSGSFSRQGHFPFARQGKSTLRALLLVVLLGVCGGAIPAARAQEAAPKEQAPQIAVTPETHSFIVYGDIRFTDPQKCETSSPTARQALTDRVAQLTPKPDFVLITGDVVLKGGNDDDWRVFDEETEALRDRRIEILSILGNHDKSGGGQVKFFDHFPALKDFPQLKERGWYSLRYANSFFILLDSQDPYSENTPQGVWLRDELEQVPEGTDFLIVVLHRPVISHPSGEAFRPPCPGGLKLSRGGHKVQAAEGQLKEMLEEWSRAHPRPKILVLSGHNHNYERYMENGITYVVTAGGGATPYGVARDAKDFYREKGPTYHYCKISLHQQKLTFEMFKLDLRGKSASWKRKDSFELKAAAPGP
ncbi:MAG: metallophosphoesterase [Acidobacteria bacterium]|nr:metallophosphoesterase [Acidobacteriota bacterium]